MTIDEEFGYELISTLIKQAQALQNTLVKLPQEVPYPSNARPRLISFVKDLNLAIITRLEELRAGPPSPSYRTIETPAKRIGHVLGQLHELLEIIVHSETHRIPASLIPPFEAMAKRFFPNAQLLVRYIWQYDFVNFITVGDVLKSLSFSGLKLSTSPPEHFIVIGFPTTAHDNILLHCSFAHELGHFLVKAAQIVKALRVRYDPGLYNSLKVDELPILWEVTLKWNTEIIADVLGIYLLGPASFLSFSEISLDTLHTPLRTHPPPHFRLSWMLTLLRRLSYLDNTDATGNVTPGKLDPKSKTYFDKWDKFLDENPIPPLEPIYACAEESLTRILDAIDQAVKSIVNTNGYSADRYAAEVGPLTERILHLIPPSEGDSVSVPCFESILNTGWAVRTIKLEEFQNVLSDSGQVEELYALQKLNDLLNKSLEYLIIKKLWEKTR
jgi:hypothetical protein